MPVLSSIEHEALADNIEMNGITCYEVIGPDTRIYPKASEMSWQPFVSNIPMPK